MVTAPHFLAAQAGLGILQAGGNAADAGIAVAAALSVLYPHMTGLGGDAFIIYYEAATRQLICYNGSGRAAALATRQFYEVHGTTSIPERGPLAALTAPGAVDAWFALHKRFGSLEFPLLLQPAIGYAEQGAPIARSLADSFAAHHAVLQADEGAARIYGVQAAPKAGEVFKQPQLAYTLRAIAKQGRDWFYLGEGAKAIEAYCSRRGSPLRAQDLAAHQGFCDKPLRLPFFDFESITTPPNSQGIALLIAQGVFEKVTADRLPNSDSAPLVHACVEAIKLSFADRDRHVGDPRVFDAWRHLLEPKHLGALAARFDPFQAFEPAVTVDQGDTAYFAAVDEHGNAVSYIQSLFHSFGAGVVVPELGVALNNRGSAFSLKENDVRSLEPGRLPFHTLMPCMLLRDGKPWLVYGSMGGEGQPQTALSLATRIACFGMDPQSAIEAPRWRWGKAWIDEPASLNIESRYGAACITGLRARGHAVSVVGEWDEAMGHAGAIVIAEDGVLHGGADPRGDGAAVGW